MELEFSGEIFYWRGPAPWFFVAVPEPEAAAIESASAQVTYGWGMIPATVTLNETAWYTALWPKDGSYIVPLKSWVRKAEGVDEGDVVTLRLAIDV